jgi:hypothetical protein
LKQQKRYLNIQEFQSKQLMRKYGVNTQPFGIADTPQQAAEVANQLSTFLYTSCLRPSRRSNVAIGAILKSKETRINVFVFSRPRHFYRRVSHVPALATAFGDADSLGSWRKVNFLWVRSRPDSAQCQSFISMTCRRRWLCLPCLTD